MKNQIKKFNFLYEESFAKYFDVIILFIVSILLCKNVINLNQSWPLNHEFESFFQRTSIYSEHLQGWDLFPIWSTLDNNGYGSSFPLFYHKTFYFFSGAINTFIQSVYISVLISVIFFLFIGALGTYTLIKYVTKNRLLAIFSAILYMSSNYTTTNWLIRGAMAEFSFAMVLPFFLFNLSRYLDKKQKGYLLGINLGILVYCHASVALYLIGILGVLLIFLIKNDNFPNKNIIIFIGITFILILPDQLIKFMFRNQFDVTRLLPDEYLPKNQFVSFKNYIYDSNYRFGETWDSFTVQIDILLIILLISFLFIFFINFLKKRVIGFDFNYFIFFIFFSLIFFIFLQLKYLNFFYEIIPGAKFIQFPWRLLSFITIFLIIINSYFFIKIVNKKYQHTFLIILIFIQLFLAPSFKKLEYGNMAFKGYSLNTKSDLYLGSYDVYTPIGVKKPKINSFLYFEKYSSKCTIKDSGEWNFDLTRKFFFNCEKISNIKFPIFFSKFHTAFLKLEDRESAIEITNANGYIEITLPKDNGIITIVSPKINTLFTYQGVFK